MLRPLSQWAWGRFARQPAWRAFVNWQAYYGPYLRTDTPQPLIQHAGLYVGDAAQQMELINGMVAGRGPAVVWAPPGCGKSRFALELARRIEQHRWQVFFVRHDEAVVREELHQLTRLKRLVFIVDDAHECPDLVKLLAAACAEAASTAPLHLVCVTRATGRAPVTRAINSVYPPGLIQEIDLGRPAPEAVRALIDQLLPKSSPHHRDTIVRFVHQSYFGAVLVCTILRRQGKLPQTFQRQDLRDLICREPLRKAVEGLCPIETALRVLAVYAARSPVPKSSAEARDLAAELSALPPASVEILIDRVLTAGLFQQYGRGLIRPIPDLLGDLILEEACLDAQGKPTSFSTQLLERLFEVDPVSTVANCADIGQLFGTPQDVDLVSAWVLSRARTVPLEPKWDVMKLLQTCQPLPVRRPGTVLDVVGILEKRGVLRRNPPAETLHGIDSVEMDSCVLLMQAGEVDLSIVPVALRLGRDLYAAARTDVRSREHVQKALEDYCRFEMGRGVAHSLAVVNTLRTWVSESDAEAAALAASLSAQFLPLEVEGPRASGDTLTILQSALNPVPAVWAVRDIGVETLVRGMAHAEIVVQCAAVAALERYAGTQLAPERVPLEAWGPQLTREMEALSTAIIQRVKAASSLPLCAIGEQQAWRWWAQELDPPHRAGSAILQAIPDTDAYRLWKALHAQRLPTSTVVPNEVRGTQARAEFFQSLDTVVEADRAQSAHALFEELDPRYPTPAAWRDLWRTVFTQTPRWPLHYQAGAVVGEFVRRNPEAAWSLLDEAESDAFSPLLPFLLVDLGKQDRGRRSQLIRRVRPGTRLEEALLRALWEAAEPDEAERALLGRGLESTDPDTVHRAAAVILSTSHADRPTAFQTVFGVITRMPDDSALWQLAIERFVDWGERVLPPRGVEPDEALGAVAADLMSLLQTRSSQLRWGYQNHTRQLANALAIFAVVCPRQLQEWIRSTLGEGKRPGGAWDDESPLSVSRLSEALAAIQESPVTTHWIAVFVDWIRCEPHLGTCGALWLAELCSLEDATVGELAQQIGGQPTPAALTAFAQFIQHQKSDPEFSGKALALLEVWTHYPSSYFPIEEAVLHALVHPSGSRRRGQASPGHERALAAIEARRASGPSPELLMGTLDRAEREVRRAMEQHRAQDEELGEQVDRGKVPLG